MKYDKLKRKLCINPDSRMLRVVSGENVNRLSHYPMRKLFISILFFMLLSISQITAATDSTQVSVPTPLVKYWTCTNTTTADDNYQYSSGSWWADMRMGDTYYRCNDAGTNSSNSIPNGIVAWGSWSHNGLVQGKGRMLCTHVIPSCGWATGPATANAP